MKLSWSMQRRVDRWKVRYEKISSWSTFVKKEIVKDFLKIKNLLQKNNKKKVKKMKIDKDKKETMFFNSDEYIGLTIDKGEINLIQKPPESFVEESKRVSLGSVMHGKECECEYCLDKLIAELKFKFDTENDE